MKTLFKNIFDFYLNASIHVAIATSSLVLSTYHFANISIDWNIVSLVFFCTLISYNFIKYFSIYQHKRKYSIKEKLIILLVFCALLLCVFSFFKLNYKTQIVTVFFGVLSVFYAIPLNKQARNLRNISGIKIYIVALCWAGVTLLLPLYQAEISLSIDVLYKFVQRFLLTLVLILIFEINDLKYDDIRLRTVPQSIGIQRTKYLIYVLLIPFFVLEFFKQGNYTNQWLVSLILVSIISLFTYFASPKRNNYYTLFWVESVPVLWFGLLYLFKMNS